MPKKISPLADIRKALGAARLATTCEIEARIAAGETVGRVEDGVVIAGGRIARNLSSRREKLMAELPVKPADKSGGARRGERKSVA